MALGDGIRRNIASVDPTERALLRDALIAINSQFFPGSRTDLPLPGGVSWWFKQDEIHQATHVHGGREFLPWHREIVNRLEQMLRSINPQLSLHYWDWTQDPRAIPNANLGGGTTGTLNLFTSSFMGYGGSTSASIGQPWLGAGYYVPGATPHRDGAGGTPADPPRNVTRFVSGSPATAAQDGQIINAADYPSMRLLLEGVHNVMHGFVNMGDEHVSFRDPFVFLLHSNVDRLFAMWQTAPGHAERLDGTTVYGSEGGGALNGAIPPWSGSPATVRPFAPPENQQDPKTYKDPAIVYPPVYDTTPVIPNFALQAGGWLVDRHPRFLADVTGDNRPDIVGFGDAGVWVSRNKGNGTFHAPQFAVASFAYNAGGWRVERHPRFLADITGDGRADIVGFGDGGVWVSRSNGNGTFQPPQLVIGNFGYNAGGWRVEQHPRFVLDLTGDGRADVIGFGTDGTWVSRNNGNGTFQAPQLVVGNFGYSANGGGWRVERHPRILADVTGDGRPDIIGFGDGGVWVSRNNGDGTFQGPQLVVASFGYTAGGWRVERHPRFAVDLTGDGRADIIGFGDGGVWVSRNNGDGTFQGPQFVVANFGYTAGGWRIEQHPRFLADTTGDGRPDIVGCGNAGVWVSRNNGNGTFQAPQLMVGNFGYNAGGWRVELHPRFMVDVNGNGRADVVGFGNAGVWIHAFS